MRKTIGSYAAEYMKKNNIKMVCSRDSVLLHDIADYAGVPHEGLKTENRIANALDRSPLFKKFITMAHRPLRCFTLIELKEKNMLK